jgi:hypothetical protein
MDTRKQVLRRTAFVAMLTVGLTAVPESCQPIAASHQICT